MLLIALTLVLAFANGANDVSKGIATLVGAGVSDYRRAVSWGSLCTMAGAIAAAFASQALVATFGGKEILVRPATSSSFLLAIAIGAIGWLLIATRTGLPVSTTHSIAGALIGAALASGNGVVWSALAQKIALPLAVSPLLALMLLLIVSPFFRRFDDHCICAQEQALPLRDAVCGAEFISPAPAEVRATLVVGTSESCNTAVARLSTIDMLHWLSAGATSFFRGLNDAPKILALGIAAALTIGITNRAMFFLVALAMGLGSLIAGFHVTRTLAEKVTPITPPNGLAANVVTSLLAALASRFALPVSTTHVASGAIIGTGLPRNEVRWKTVGEMLLAWVVTLPISALLAGGALAALR